MIRRVFKFISSDERTRCDRPEYLVLEVQVPTYSVGSVIGKGGEAIKRVSAAGADAARARCCRLFQFQQQFSVRCAFAKEDEPGANESYRVLIIRGQRQHVYEAEVEIRRLIADLPQYEQAEMFIPEHVCGYLIGRNGSHIKEIRDTSKARLSMDRKIIDNLENKRFSRLVISGTCEQIAAAKVSDSSALLPTWISACLADSRGRTPVSIRTETTGSSASTSGGIGMHVHLRGSFAQLEQSGGTTRSRCFVMQ